MTMIVTSAISPSVLTMTIISEISPSRGSIKSSKRSRSSSLYSSLGFWWYSSSNSSPDSPSTSGPSSASSSSDSLDSSSRSSSHSSGIPFALKSSEVPFEISSASSAPFALQSIIGSSSGSTSSQSCTISS